MAKYTRVSQIDPENHPLFNRLWTTEGFERLTSESVEKFLDTPGLKIALFGDDPNNQKETLDILVIGAELKKAIEAALAPENGLDERCEGGPRLGCPLGNAQTPRRGALSRQRLSRCLSGTEGLG